MILDRLSPMEVGEFLSYRLGRRKDWPVLYQHWLTIERMHKPEEYEAVCGDPMLVNAFVAHAESRGMHLR